MDILSPVHLIILLGVALLVFGPRRLPELGKGLGHAMREFREATSGLRVGAMSGTSQVEAKPTALAQARTAEGTGTPALPPGAAVRPEEGRLPTEP